MSNETASLKSPRRLKSPRYRRGHFQKRIKHPGPKLAGSWTIFWRSLRLFGKNKRLFGGILIIYAVLSIILVKGVNNVSNLPAAKDLLEATKATSLSTGTALIGNLINASTTATPTTTSYESVLLIVISLVVIWALRQVYGAKERKKGLLKAAFYKSTHPMVPFMIILLVITIQLIPLIVGATVYSTVVSNGLAVSGLEKLAWGGALFLAALWSLHMITASIFALYIVTLPDVLPLQALRSARELVRFRRWTVMRKLLFLPCVILPVTTKF